MRSLGSIRQIDYTVIFARNLERMRHFYEATMGFRLKRELGPAWIEYSVGPNVLALTERGGMFSDPPPTTGALALQLAFRVSPEAVDQCADELRSLGVPLEAPPTDQPWGHRTVFFRDPDGNVLEIYADI